MADTPTSSGTRAYRMLTPERAYWRESIAMKIPNTNLAEQLGATRLGMRLWRLPPWSANTLHRHAAQEEVFVVLRGTGRLRVGEDTLTVPEGGAVLVQPAALRQLCNDSDAEVLWLVAGAPYSELDALSDLMPEGVTPGEFLYPHGMSALPPELGGHPWPPAG